MAITYFGSASNPSDGSGLETGSAVAVVPPADMQAGDLVVVVVMLGSTSYTISNPTTGGQTWTESGYIAYSTTIRAKVYQCVFDGTWTANPEFQSSASHSITVVMHVFRPDGSGVWNTIAALSSGTYTAPSSPYDVTIDASAISAGVRGGVCIAVWASVDDNQWTLQTAGWSVLGGAQYRNDGATYDRSLAFAYKVLGPNEAATSVVSRQATNQPDAGAWIILSYYDETSPIAVTPLESTGTLLLVNRVVDPEFESTSELNCSAVAGVFIAVTLPAIVSVGGSFTAGIALVADVESEFPEFLCEVGTGPSVECTFPQFLCESQAFTNITAQTECLFPEFECDAFVGAVAECTFPELQVESDATAHVVASAECLLPEFQAEAFAFVSASADVECVFPQLQCEASAFAGQVASGECEFPEFLAEAISLTGAVVVAECLFPVLRCEASAGGPVVVDVECTIPAFICEANLMNQSRFYSQVLQFERWQTWR